MIWMFSCFRCSSIGQQLCLCKLAQNANANGCDDVTCFIVCESSDRRMRTARCWRLGSATTWPNWCLWTQRGERQGPVHAGKHSPVTVLKIKIEIIIMCLFFRKKTERSKKFFTDLMAKEHVPTMINPKPCGHLCCCAITGCEEVTPKCCWR